MGDRAAFVDLMFLPSDVEPSRAQQSTVTASG